VIYAKLQYDRVAAEVDAAAKAGVAQINDKVADWISALQVLSTSNYLDSGAVQEFYNQARRTLAINKDWDNIALYTPTATQVLNLRLPSNAPLAVVKGNPTIIRHAAQTGQVAVSDIFLSRVSNKQIIVAAVPVIRNGSVVFVLTCAVTPQYFSTLFQNSMMNASWNISVLDGKGTFVVSTHGPQFDQSISNKRPDLNPLHTQQSSANNKRGIYQISAHQSTSLPSWTVVVTAPWMATLWSTATFLSVSIFGALILATAALVRTSARARRFVGDIKRLLDQATSVGSGIETEVVSSPIVELNEVSLLLQESGRRLSESKESLKQTETRLHVAINSANLGVWGYDVTTGQFGCSARARRILGVPPGVEIDFQLLQDVCHPDDVDAVRKSISKSIADTKPLDVECRVIRSDGEVRWVLISARGQFNDAGHPLNLHGVIFDVTERNTAFERSRQQEILLKDQNLELEALYSCMPLGIAHMDRDLRFLRVNERLAAINGRSVEDHIGHSLYEIVPQLSVELENIYRELYQSGQPVLDVEISGATPAEPDSARHWLVNFYPVLLHDGELKGACAVVLDITARKLAENAIIATSLKLKHVNQRLMRVEEEIKRKLAQELHDEFGQALTGLKLTLEAILQGACSHKEDVSSALSLVIQLISQTRTLSLNLRPPMLDDFGLIATLSWFCKDYQSKTHIQVSFHHEGIGTRRFPSEIEVVGFRIVQEGLTNIARHAMAAEATLRATVREENLIIELIDNGVGFTVSDSPNWTESHGLLGMHERAESVGGRLTIESSLRKGTRIQAILPMASKPLGGVQTKGVSMPVDVFQLIAATSARTRMQAAVTRGLTLLVGRQREIEVFNKLVEQTVAGRGSILAMVGEPGMGKSRLVHEFTHHQLPSGWLVLEGASVSYGKAAPYFPLIEMLRRFFQISDGDGQKEIQERVVMHVLELNNTLKDAIPPILSLLSVFPEENQAPASGQRDWLSHHQDLFAMVKRFDAMDPQQRRRHTLDAIKRVFIRESQRQPLVLVLEDLHWIDSETQAFLDRFAESLPLTRILLLVDYRPGYNHGWTDKTYYTELRVDPLQPASTEELFQHLLGPNTDLMPLKKTLMERTVGNPFFAEESVQSLVEAGVLVGEKGAYWPDLSINEIRIPSTVQNLIANRIDRLSIEEKRILQIASVIGVIVPFTLLRAAAGIEDEDLRGHLSRLQTAEFLYETNLFPEVEYSFKHAITCEVAYGELTSDRRTFWHRRVLEVLENQPLSHDHVEKLAHHAFCGENWEKAVRYQKEAGDTALTRSSFRNAVLYFEHALEALQHLPQSPDNLRQAIDLRFDIRNALFVLNDFKRGFEYLEEAKEAARALNDHDRLGKLFTWMTAYWNLVGKSEQAVIAGKQALDYSIGLRNIDSNIVARYFLGLAYNSLGQFELSIQELKGVLSLIPRDRKFDFFGTTGILSVLCRAWLIRGLAQTGHFSETLEYGDEAIQSALERDHPFSIIYAYYAIGAVAVMRGDFDHAIGALEKGLRLCESAEIPVQRPLIVSCLAVAYAFVGRIDEALGLLDTITDRNLWVGGTGTRQLRLGKAMGMVWQVETYMLAGRYGEADVLARQALEVFRESKDRGSEAELRYLLAEILVRRHPSSFSQAEESYRAASILAHELGMRPLQAHCYLGLGTIHAQSKDTRIAQSEIGTARELYRDMHMPFWVGKSAFALTAIG